jgi:preprotein translocase subunit SecY
MFETVKKAFQIKEIRMRIFFTLLMLVVIRFRLAAARTGR